VEYLLFIDKQYKNNPYFVSMCQGGDFKGRYGNYKPPTKTAQYL